MKVAVDLTLCQGHGQCQDAAPRIFELDDEGFARVLQAEVPGEDGAARARDAADRCPVQAIELRP